jgi:hypothetical protein
MAKKKENKNRSYREMIRRQQKEMDTLEKQRRKSWEKEVLVLMLAFSALTLLIVASTVFIDMHQAFIFIYTILLTAYAFFCIVCWLKEPDHIIKKMSIVISSCAAVSFISMLVLT